MRSWTGRGSSPRRHLKSQQQLTDFAARARFVAEYISTSPYILHNVVFQESVYILSWGRRIFPPSLVAAQYLGSRLDYSPPSTISPVMRQRDYQLLRFPHSNINIVLSSSSRGLLIIIQRQRLSFLCSLYLRDASIILFFPCPRLSLFFKRRKKKW